VRKTQRESVCGCERETERERESISVCDDWSLKAALIGCESVLAKGNTVCVCVRERDKKCMCVTEGEREKRKEREREREREGLLYICM